MSKYCQTIWSLRNFYFHGFLVRLLDIKDKPEFLASDIVAILYPGFNERKLNSILSTVPATCYGRRRVQLVTGVKNKTILTGSGFSLLARKSTRANGRELARWVRNHVLPQLPQSELSVHPKFDNPIRAIFNFSDQQIRVIGTSVSVKWVALDCLDILYPDLDLRGRAQIIDSIPGNWRTEMLVGTQWHIVLSEPGFYHLLALANNEMSCALLDWVRFCVIPRDGEDLSLLSSIHFNSLVFINQYISAKNASSNLKCVP